MALSTDKILNATVKLALSSLAPQTGSLNHLDIGSGTGALISLLKEKCSHIQSTACDYTDELMKIPGQKVDIADLNYQPLPYNANYFDLVTCTEVIEHLENHRKLIREIFFVTKPGGTVIFTTPNVLSIKSRIRYLFFGFANLFGPLPDSTTEKFSTVGHITPVSFFYLSHALAETGFSDIKLEIDKPQRSTIPNLVLLWPIIAFFGYFAKRKEIRKFKTIDHSNQAIIEKINNIKVLLGRTIIVAAKKPVITIQ